jgi:hypothetical protein
VLADASQLPGRSSDVIGSPRLPGDYPYNRGLIIGAASLSTLTGSALVNS